MSREEGDTQSLRTEPDSQNILRPLGLGDNMERLRAGPTFYDTPPGTVPKIRLPPSLLSPRLVPRFRQPVRNSTCAQWMAGGRGGSKRFIPSAQPEAWVHAPAEELRIGPEAHSVPGVTR
ncbi:unnamed protein product [Pleuronectes platessa]|uniref:Uncharacterized protein n=1 Tax=Pleuronectes platessa TaxID=8262 RepID=A0A9N7YMC5_PLEPL|nr:unnamed protein product [Pleuronectes platessa]